IVMAILATSVSAFAQSGQSPLNLKLEGVIQAAAGQAATQTQETTRSLSIDEAVRLALEQNLGIQIQQIDPQISDLGIAQAKSFWAPQLSTTLQKNSNNQPITSALTGALPQISTGQFGTGVSLAENLPWGANYAVNWNNARFTTSDVTQTLNP